MTIRLKAYLVLALIKFGISIYEFQPFGFLDDEDKENLKRLWSYHDKFSSLEKDIN